MSEEPVQKPPPEQAAPAEEHITAGFTDDRPPTPPGESLMSALKEGETTPLRARSSNQTRNLLMLAGIVVIALGALMLWVLGPKVGQKPTPTTPAEAETVRLRRILSKWDSMDTAERRAALPGMVQAFKLDEDRNNAQEVADLRLAVLLTVPDAGKDAVPELVKALREEDFNARFYAAWALGRIGPEAAEAVPALLEARANIDGDIRRKVIFALGRIKPPAELAVPVLIETFKDDDVDVQTTAVEALAGYGKEAVPALIKALDDRSSSVRYRAILTLAKIGPAAAAALPALRVLYLDRASGLQDEAAAALRSLGKQAIPTLTEPLATNPVVPPGQVVLGLGSPWALFGVWRDYAADHRRALTALGAIGPDALESLLIALKNPNADVRKLAAGELGELGYRDERIIGPLADAMNDPQDVVRQEAGFALRNLNPDTRLLLSGLSRALKNADGDVRLNAVQFLGRLGTAAAPLLTEALRDKDAVVYEQAVKSLSGLEADNEYLLATVAPLLQDSDTQVRQNAAVVLRRCGARALPLLIAALKDKEAAVRRDAIWGVTNIPGDDKIIQPALVEAFADPDTYVRAQAIAGLGTIGYRALPQLKQAVKDKEADVRLRAVEALVRLNPNFKEVLPTLLPAIKDQSPAVRLVVVAGLVRFGDAAVPHLIEAFRDDDPEVWKQAKNALLEIEVPDKVLFPQILKALKDEDKFVRQGAVYVMARFKEDGVAPLIEALKDSDPGVQFRAADALDNIGPPARKAIPELVVMATTHADAKTRRTAVMALTTIHGFADCRKDPVKAVPGLIELLGDDNPKTRWGAAQTLGALGPPARQAVPALTKLLKDTDLSVSQSAQFALRRINQK
jgi:HEAT repeat protein